MRATHIRGATIADRTGRSIAHARRQFSIALFGVRAVIAGLFIAHGAQKLFGWFSGEGLAAWTASVGKMGIQPAAV